MNVSCPECATVYRIDPARVPDGGARTRCRQCDTSLLITTHPGAAAPGSVVAARRLVVTQPAAEPPTEPAAEPVGTPNPETTPGVATPQAASPGPAVPVFGPQDPGTRARRLARALVSDIKVYNQERWESGLSAGTLRRDFRDEILKSWDEYVEQVGEALAKQTPYFRDALNDILARGERVF
jgi:predicted Zn finger-like uncharacterized protein